MRTSQHTLFQLEALVVYDIHAHESDYVATEVLGSAYGVNDRLTVNAELSYVRCAGLRDSEAVPVPNEARTPLFYAASCTKCSDDGQSEVVH